MFVMALLLKINFDNVYDVAPTANVLNTSTFTTELADGSTIPLHIEISNEAHELKPDLFNLAFGPLDQKGDLNDWVQLEHRDHSKVFSTILSEAHSYLVNHPDHSLGIDGSDKRRAYLYHRLIKGNFDYLSQYFNLYGMKYYVRISRFEKQQYENPFDFSDVHPLLIPLEKETFMKTRSLYNYYVFDLKQAFE